MRCKALPTTGSWVTITTAVPSASLAERIRSRTVVAEARSSWLVGSSASSSRGRLARATATASRCCSPPDSRPAWRWATRARPMASSSSAVRRRLAARPRVGGPLREHDVAGGGLVGQQVAAGVLQDHAHVVQPHGRGRPAVQVVDPAAAHLDPARSGLDQPGQQPQQRGLARAGRPEQSDAIAGRDGQVDAAQRGHLLAERPVHLDQAVAVHHSFQLRSGTHVGVSRS